MIVLKSKDAQPQFDDVDDLAHVFDFSVPEDEWKIRLPRELGVDAREREQLGDEWKIKLPYAIGKTARERATEEGMSLSSLARRAIS